MTETPIAPAPTPEIDSLIRENEELHRSLDEVKRQMTSRIVMAELKAEAARAGMIDLDVLRLVDMDGIKLDPEQNVLGAIETVAKLKEQKPYLFQGKSSSAARVAPTVQPLVNRRATEMTEEEYQIARTALLRQFR